MPSDHPAFGCWFYLDEITKNCERSWSRWVELPFVPQKKMTFQFGSGDNADGGWDFCPHHVIYLVDHETVYNSRVPKRRNAGSDFQADLKQPFFCDRSFGSQHASQVAAWMVFVNDDPQGFSVDRDPEMLNQADDMWA